jgi:hypothetical protein
LSTVEAGRRGQTDESQLAFSSSDQRVLVAFNVAHFATLHATWLRDGRHHAGIVVSGQRPIGETIRRLSHLAASLKAESMRNRLEYRSDRSWRLGAACAAIAIADPGIPLRPNKVIGHSVKLDGLAGPPRLARIKAGVIGCGRSGCLYENLGRRTFRQIDKMTKNLV